MRSFVSFMEKHFIPVAAKIGSQRHLVAIRDGFVAMMPLIIAGSFAVLLNNVLFTPWGLLADWLNLAEDGVYLTFTMKYIVPAMGNVWWGTFAVMALILTFTIGYSLAKSYDINPISGGVVSTAAFLSIVPQAHGEAGWGYFHWGYFNAGSLFAAIIISLLVTTIFSKLMKSDKLIIKMPDSVPPAVAKSFAATIPGILAILIASFIPVILGLLNQPDLFELISGTIQKPLQGFSQGLIPTMVITMLINLFWFFGLHGANLLGPIVDSLYLPALLENEEAIRNGLEATNIVTRVWFDAFVHLGGAGATLALLIAIFLGSKREDYRSVAKLGLPSGLFQINEPVLFGLPIVLNPVLFIPFLIVPPVLAFIAYVATWAGIAGKTYVAIPWTTPPVLGAFLATGGSFGAALVALVNLVVAVLIYYPFVLLANKREQ